MNANLAVESKPEPTLMTTEITLDSLKAEFEELKTRNKSICSMNEELISRYQSLSSKMESRLLFYSENEKRWKDLQAKMEKNSAEATKKIKLDVGGRLFSASKETLMSKPSYFCGLLSSNYQPDGEDGSFFVDRNPIVFDRILDYLRTGKLEIRELSELHLEKLKDDFDYYSIELPEELQPKLSNVISWEEKRKSINASFSNNNLTVSKRSGGGKFNCAVLGNQAVDRYTVHIDSRGGGSVMIGFSCATIWRLNDLNYINNGWFICLSNGDIYGIGVGLNGESYTKRINNGDYLTVIREGVFIRFEINKVDLGFCFAFKNVPNQSLFPAVEICSNNVVLTLVVDY